MDIRTILQSWDLGAVTEIEEVIGGAVNRVFRVSTSREQVYLRMYRVKERQTVVREHALLAHVSAAGLPAVTPISSTSGDSVIMFGDTPCAVYPQAPGEQLAKAALGRQHAEAAGEMLGRLHACLVNLPDVGYRRYPLHWSVTAWLERLSVIATAVRKRKDHPDDERVLQRIHEQSEWLSDPQCIHEYEPKFPAQLTHGDYHDANLFFEHGKVCAVIDWEQAAFMPRAYEVARAVAYMFDVAPEPTRAFLGAYRSVTHISDEELTDGARAWGIYSDHYTWALEEVYWHDNDRARRFIPLPFRAFQRAWDAVKR